MRQPIVLILCLVTLFTGCATVPKPPSSPKPIIGVSSVLGKDYFKAVYKAGGVPVTLPSGKSSKRLIGSYLKDLDGLLMTGGPDIPPSEYGETAHKTVSALGEQRYTFEKELIRRWIKQTDKPLLGVCLGGQWINVTKGGTLVQDIPSALGLNHRHVTHKVLIEDGSKLRSIVETSSMKVNSRHHQAVKKLGKGLTVAARSDDGVVEAIETTDPTRFLIGVQWHPENLAKGNNPSQKLFKSFVKASAQTKP